MILKISLKINTKINIISILVSVPAVVLPDGEGGCLSGIRRWLEMSAGRVRFVCRVDVKIFCWIPAGKTVCPCVPVQNLSGFFLSNISERNRKSGRRYVAGVE